MAKTRRNVMWAAFVSASVFSGSQAIAADSLALVLHIRNHASVSLGDLAEAEREATLIYGAAGIKTIWMNPGETADSSAPGRHLVVLLLDRTMSQNMIDTQQLADDVLGQALRVTGRAYIIVPRVADAALRFECTFRIALGRVLAHEIGHLVLPSYSHSSDGIMRAIMDFSKFPQRFSRQEVATLRMTVAADLAARPRDDACRELVTSRVELPKDSGYPPVETGRHESAHPAMDGVVQAAISARVRKEVWNHTEGTPSKFFGHQ